MKPGGVNRQGNTLITSESNVLAALKGAKRHAHAKDEQDILPDKAPSGNETTGHHKRHNAKRRGRKRGQRSMGRYPFLAEMENYLTDSVGFKAKSTLNNERRMLRNLHNDIQQLYQDGIISTTNPKTLIEKDIREIHRYLIMRENKEQAGNLDVNTIAKYMQYLKNLVNWCGNSCMIRLQMQGKLPKRSNHKAIISLDEEDALELFTLSQTGYGWNGAVIAFIIPTHIFLGLRASELQRAELRDINLRKWTFFIRYPKGGPEYQKTMSIPTELRPYVLRFLEQRVQEIKKRGVDIAAALIPVMTKYRVVDKPPTPAYFWRLKRELEDRVGIKFHFQMLRRTSGQLILNANKNNLPIVQKHLRHSSLTITQKHYVEMQDKVAADVVDDVWSHSSFAKKAAK
ncbi:MAG: site-specific integrase [Candidatus Thermoplasmatota archaeon]|nr:site-specific integrase [Euryarchaeota archaeon]MBU4031187.1 site-specific integrase [Candidatus Thermoplasmatota archaeon]MBU4143555.1 site-specific integrase [Candidatus Thermoplasmatota archaeon]MBU4591265.1 site-specific integrase [Candidatus Thermoplasmatota archaeon]